MGVQIEEKTMSQKFDPKEIELPEINRGDTKWVEWEKIDYHEFIPGWREIVEMIESGEPAYLDLEFTV